MTVSAGDKGILRELARRQADIAASQKACDTIKKWEALGSGKPIEPLVRIASVLRIETISQMKRCEGAFAREVEGKLLGNIVGTEVFHDDSVTPNYYPITHNIGFNLFGLNPKKTPAAAGSVGYHIEPLIEDLQSELYRFVKADITVDKERAEREAQVVADLFGEILPAKTTMSCLNGNITVQLVLLMGMENMFIAMKDYPDHFHSVMRLACESYEEMYALLEAQGLLFPTTQCEPVGQDTYSFTDKLPQNPKSSRDVWGYINSQEAAPISPAMYGEFVFPYIKRLASQYGLLSYGCCEPVHPLWDNYLSTLPNIGRVSVSAWCDEEFMGERLRGTGIVYHRKPTANFLGFNTPLDEDAVRAYFKKTAISARGCCLEVTQREVSTSFGNMPRVVRYAQLAKETVMEYWRP